MRYAEVLTFPITLRRDADQPLAGQIADQIAAAIDAGGVRPGARIPSSRTLARALETSRGVIAQAFDELHAKGYLVTRPGSGTFVRDGGENALPATAPVQGTPQMVLDFVPGQLCGEAFPIRAWRAAWRQVSYRPPRQLAAGPDGLEALRIALLDHLAGSRGIASDAHELLITAGPVSALRLVAQALGPHLAVERPAPPEVLQAADTSRPALPIEVDEQGADPATLPHGIAAAVLFPECNRPLGTVMSGQRMARWHEWTHGGAHLIQMLSGAWPQPRLAPLGDRTVIVGGFDELLTDTLRVGYVMAPQAVAEAIRRLAGGRETQPPELVQAALAHLLAGGAIARQTRWLRHVLAHKREVVAETLGRSHVPGSAEPGTVLIRLSAAALGRLRDSGVGLLTLDAYGLPERQTVVLGFGHLPDSMLRTALQQLLALIAYDN